MQKGDRRKLEILDTAERLFFGRGYQQTTIQDILDALACSKGSFYHHFESKLEVLATIAQAHAAESRRRFDALDPLPPVERLNRLLRHASLLREEEAGLLRSLASLDSLQEGALLLQVLDQSAWRAFYSEYEKVLTGMKKDDLASFSGAVDLRLAFGCFLGGCRMLLQEALQTELQYGWTDLLRALRKQHDLALGLRAGSTVILETADLDALIRRVRPL